MKMKKSSTILVTGASGMVGNALVNKLKQEGFKKILTPSSKELNFIDRMSVDNYLKKNKPDYIFHLAARVGGIIANVEHPAEFLYENLLINSNVIDAAKSHKVKKLLFLGSSCIYPKEAPQPMKEELLLTGKLEPTNEGYALSKIAGLKLCEYYNKQYGTNFICLMPSNIYGPGDKFNSDKSHVISALISRFVDAKENNKSSVVVWGSGKPRREFLFVDDVADAIIYFMNKYDAKDLPPFVNIGTGTDISIKELTEEIKNVVVFKGKIEFDSSKPDGMMRKLLDVSKANSLGWKAKTPLKEGLKKTVEYFYSIK